MSSGTDIELGSGVKKGYTRAEAQTTQEAKEQTRWIKDLFRYGVPVVLSSGNEGDNGRRVIDHIPQVLETEDLPIINVGAATLEGKAATFFARPGHTRRHTAHYLRRGSRCRRPRFRGRSINAGFRHVIRCPRRGWHHCHAHELPTLGQEQNRDRTSERDQAMDHNARVKLGACHRSRQASQHGKLATRTRLPSTHEPQGKS